MPQAKSNCFVIIPFRPELHYLYLFLKQHLEQTFPIVCERGDSTFTADSLLGKIKRSIGKADVLIADISGNNPNVFYEVGIAHALEKPVILITGNEIEQMPTDIKQFECIQYGLDHQAFLRQLDKAMRAVLGAGFEALYEAARDLLERFRQDTGQQPRECSQEEFIKEAEIRSQELTLPKPEDSLAVARFLPDLLAKPIDIDMMVALKRWIDQTLV